MTSAFATSNNRFIHGSCESSFEFGFFGYLGYDTVRFIETLPHLIPARTDTPDTCLTIYQGVINFNLRDRTAELCIANSEFWPDVSVADIVNSLDLSKNEITNDLPVGFMELVNASSSIEQLEYCGLVDRALEYIKRGDIYQVQLGQEISIRADIDPETVYRRLRHRNPAPYMYLANMKGLTLIGASPEVFVRIIGDEIVMRPIAGTVRAGSDEEEARKLAKSLQEDEKERAEHVMLVDLCRNDLGRICAPRSLLVDELIVTERYSHVIHLVSNVRAKLRGDCDVYDVITACFPAGTMTGAPKVRAMEIIEEFENSRRGIYAGAVGLIDFGGFTDLALCIRTAVHTGEDYIIRASAGIVADSVPIKEWNETIAKLGATYWAITGKEL